MALVWVLGLTVITLVQPGEPQTMGLLVAAPFLAAVVATPRDTFDISCLTLTAAAAMALASGPSTEQLVRIALIVVASVAAVLASVVRKRGEEDLRTVAAVANAVQQAMLRPIPEVVAGIPVSVRYASAASAARVGGDLYEVTTTRHGTRFLVGDVRGKGLDAVRLATVALGSFREAAHREADLSGVMAALDAAVARESGPEDFVTAVVVELRPDRTAAVAACGHPAPVLLRGDSCVEVEVEVTPPLGLGYPAISCELALRAGDRLLLYTDGVSEARRAGACFPVTEGAEAAFSGRSLPDALAELEQMLVAWTGGSLCDDVAMLALEVIASPPVTSDSDSAPAAVLGTAAVA